MDKIQDVRPPEKHHNPNTESSELPPEEKRHVPKGKSGITLKRKIQIGLLLIVLVAIGYSVWWVKSTMTLRAEAVVLAEKAESFEKLQGAVETERDRCEGFITQGEGDFGSFEYCKAFVTWANSHLRE